MSSRCSTIPKPRARPEKDAELSGFALKLMQAEDRRFAIRNLKLLAVIAAAMVSFFAVLDHFAYPEFMTLFAALRWTCASFIMILLLMVRGRTGKRYFRAFTIVIPLVPAFFIATTIFVTQDPASGYYAGLSLCIVAIGFLFQWTYREAFAVSGLVLLMYLAASAPTILQGMSAPVAAGLFSNLVFLVATGAVVVAGSVSHNRIRVEEFRGRDRLRREKNSLRSRTLELRRALKELEETESQLIQSGKMASLGQLSAGVIHEIGNPLNHSNQALFLLRRRLRNHPEDKTIREAVADIQDSVDRMKEIVKDLREFSHKRSELRIDFPVVESVEVALKILRKEIEDHGIEVDLRLDGAARVEGVKNQLAQIFINLIHNAVQALGAGKGDARRSGRIEISAREEEGRVIVSVRDNGPGIPEGVISQIFDPFFTTKEVGEGTGLGLSICFRIAEAHGGSIKAESDGLSFTEFQLCLPSAAVLPDSSARDFQSHHSNGQPVLRHEKATF